MTFETAANRAEGWRQIAAVIQEKVIALSAGVSPAGKFHPHHWSERLLLTVRFARLLLRRRLRGLAGIGGAFR